MTSKGSQFFAGMAGIALTLAACSSSQIDEPAKSAAGQPATISHIHGLGVDSKGVLHVATHFGLIRQAGGGWVYASTDRNDHMGFSLEPNVGVMYRSGHSAARPSLGVQSSTDGASWTHLSDVADPPVDFHTMAVSFADANSLWGWDSGGRGTFRSTDGGKTWSALGMQGIERQIYVLSGAASANVVYAGTATGAYRSTDGGTMWEKVQGLGKGWAIAIGADPKDGKHFLVFAQGGMKNSNDGGATWADAGAGLPANAEITSLTISPVDPKVAFAADSTSVFQTTDGGKTWTAMNTS